MTTTTVPDASSAPLLGVRDLRIAFPGDAGAVVDGLTFDVRAGEILAVVGESGSGKSLSALAMLDLLPANAEVSGEILFRGANLLALREKDLRRLRGTELGMVFQEALAALNPLMTVGAQIAEAVRQRRSRLTDAQVDARVLELLDHVGIAHAKERRRNYPHELSGGMRQRVMIAMAMANDPAVLIADEPTTALDVTIQAQVLDVLKHVQETTGSSIILITHDLGVVAGLADRVAVMYAGHHVEIGETDDVFYRSRHPYTRGLLSSFPSTEWGIESERLRPIPGYPPSAAEFPTGCRFHPRCPIVQLPTPCATERPELVASAVTPSHAAACHFADRVALMPESPPAGGEASSPPQVRSRRLEPRGEAPEVLRVEHLVKRFPVRAGVFGRTQAEVHAVSDLSVSIRRGETLGLVGESGCGKTTVSRMILGLVEPTSGSIEIRGEQLVGAGRKQLRRLRTQAQIVFQDPYASLNPRLTVAETLAEPLKISGRWNANGKRRVERVTALVGLGEQHLSRYPREFSGGQRQRIGIARALIMDPALVVLDEPVSALDVSIQAGVLNLLEDLQAELGVSFLFVAHDLSVVRHLSHRVAVMYLGKVVEAGNADDVYRRPSHPYTEALLSAVPVPDPRVERRRERIVLKGDMPSPLDPPSGCPFRTRCWRAQEVCAVEEPALEQRGTGQRVACHFPSLGDAPVSGRSMIRFSEQSF